MFGDVRGGDRRDESGANVWRGSRKTEVMGVLQ